MVSTIADITLEDKNGLINMWKMPQLLYAGCGIFYEKSIRLEAITIIPATKPIMVIRLFS